MLMFYSLISSVSGHHAYLLMLCRIMHC